MSEQANANDNVSFERQAFLDFHELLLEAGAATECDYLIVLYHCLFAIICLFDKLEFMMVQSYTSSACIGLYIVSTTLRWHSSASERGWVLISIRTQEGSRCASFRILGSSNST